MNYHWKSCKNPALDKYSNSTGVDIFISVSWNDVIVFTFDMLGLPEVFPWIIVIGALGRCGKGALEIAHKLGLPK